MAKDSSYIKAAKKYRENAISEACGRAWIYFKLHADCKTPEFARKAFSEVAFMATQEAEKSIQAAQAGIAEEQEKNKNLRKKLAEANQKIKALEEKGEHLT